MAANIPCKTTTSCSPATATLSSNYSQHAQFTALLPFHLHLNHHISCSSLAFHHHRLLIGTAASSITSFHFNPPDIQKFDFLNHINVFTHKSAAATPKLTRQRRFSATPNSPSSPTSKHLLTPADLKNHPDSASDDHLYYQSLPLDDCLVPITSVPNFGLNQKPIEHLAAIHSCNLLYSVSDGVPHLHSLDAFRLYHSFPDFKAPYSFDVWTSSPASPTSPATYSNSCDLSDTKLAIGLHKRLIVVTLSPTLSLSSPFPTEAIHSFPIPVAARSVCFTHQGARVCIASSRELSSLNLSTGEFTVWHNWATNPPLSSSPSTSGGFFNVGSKYTTRVVSASPTSNEVLAFNNTYVLKFDPDGQLVVKFDWGVQLTDIIQLGPYYVGVSHPKSNSGIHVRIPSHSSPSAPPVTVQHLHDMKGIQCMLPCPHIPGSFLVAHGPSTAGTINGSCLTLIVSAPFEMMLNRITTAGFFDTAFSLVDATGYYAPADDRLQWMNSIHLANVLHSIRAGKFDDALAGFRDLCVPVTQVLEHFPFMSEPKEQKSIPVQNSTEARRALIRFLTERRAILNRLRNPPASVTPSAGSNHALNTTLPNSSSSLPAVSSTHAGTSLFPGLLRRSAVSNSTTTVASSTSSCFSTIAQDMMVSMSNSFTSLEMDTEAKLVDMALVRAYLVDSSDIMLGSLLRIKNECPIEETVHILLEHGKFMLAVDFYFSKGVYDRAFELLMRKASEPDSVDKGRTLVTYLQKLEMSPENLPTIFKYLGWIFQEDEDRAMEFVQDCWLDATQVVEFLRKISPRHVSSYLEYVIRTQHRESATLHEEYIRSLIDTMVSARGGDSIDGTQGVVPMTDLSSEEEQTRNQSKEAGMNRYHVPTIQNQSTSPTARTSTNSDSGLELDHTNNVKLINFLQWSSIYNPEMVLEMIPEDGFLEVRLLLYEQIGNITQTLHILIHELEDIDRAKRLVQEGQYARYQAELIRQCVQASWCTSETILGALVQFGSGLPVDLILDTIDRLDPHLDQIVDPILVPLFTRVVADCNQSQVVKALAEREHNVTKVQLTQLQLQCVTVNDQYLCSKCNKKIGHSAIVTWFNDQTVVHFACASSSR